MDDGDPLTQAWINLENALESLGEVIVQGSSALQTGGFPFQRPSSRFEKDIDYIALSRKLVRMRQAIEGHPAFSGLFSDPALGILLDLFLSHLDQKLVSVTDTAISGNIPTSTALRWLALLEARGYIERKRDDKDQRRSFVSLTTVGFRQVQNLLADLQARTGI